MGWADVRSLLPLLTVLSLLAGSPEVYLLVLAQYTLPGAKERWAYMSWLRTSFSSTAIGL